MPIAPAGVIASATRGGGATSVPHHPHANGGHLGAVPRTPAASLYSALWRSRYNNSTAGTKAFCTKAPTRSPPAAAADDRPLGGCKSVGRSGYAGAQQQHSPRIGRCVQPPAARRRQSRVTLVLDLDETLVHSSFDPVPADLHLPVALDGEVYTAYVKKRPHVDEFLARCTELFDVVVWTASLAVYADPLVDELCRSARCGNVKRMFRESCTQMAGGGYAKDLSKCGRSLDDVCILDNSPSVAQLQPRNLIPIVSWYDDPRDTCLRDLLPHLEQFASMPNVRAGIARLPRAVLPPPKTAAQCTRHSRPSGSAARR